jgi:uncharacterized protein (TIGR00369 family)
VVRHVVADVSTIAVMNRAMATPDDINRTVAELYPAASGMCRETGPNWALTSIRPDPATRRPGNIISGPTIFGLADCGLWFALFATVGIEPMALTSELSIRYLRPARGDELFAHAQIHHAGKRSVIGSIEVWVDDTRDQLVAVAQGTYVRPAQR